MFRNTNETRFDGPCQGTGGNFGFNTLQLWWQLRLTAGLRRTRTAVSSVFLATAAQGLQLDIAGFHSSANKVDEDEL